jgi:hypothetical protein
MMCRYCHSEVELGGDRLLYNAGSDLRHHCEPPEAPSLHLCYCEQQIWRYADGTAKNLDGTLHQCQPRPHTQQTWVTRKSLVTPVTEAQPNKTIGF